jgi:hypothetical protein
MRWILGIGVFSGLLYLLVKPTEVAAAAPAAPQAPATPPKGPTTILVTDHDAAWDYKLENGRWYTRKKGSTGSWLDMQSNLTAANYTLAVQRLTDHLKKNGRI